MSVLAMFFSPARYSSRTDSSLQREARGGGRVPSTGSPMTSGRSWGAAGAGFPYSAQWLIYQRREMLVTRTLKPPQ